MTAPEFIAEQLGLIRRTFFARKSDEKSFFQQRDLLQQAVAFPAVRLKERFGVKATKRREVGKLLDLYGRILRTVIQTIRQHGDVKNIERFSVYFLKAVQTHMDHHGEEYYQEAKGFRSADEFVPDVMRAVRVGEEESSAVDVVIGVYEAIKSRGGRKKKPAPVQPTLF